MRILSLIHEDEAPTGLFGEVARERGHEVVEWNAQRGLPPAPLDDFDAFFVFGGSMHVDQEERHPWLREEDALIRTVLDRGAPIFAVCLGSQLLAKAAGARVGPASEPEIGWYEVELTDEAQDDPVLGALPRAFEALQWHSYAFDLPAGAVALAQSPVCLQSFRLGDAAWGVQFHPEVTAEILTRWVDGHPYEFAEEPMAAWNEVSRRLAGAFLDVATAR